jgi:hypothetical protein
MKILAKITMVGLVSAISLPAMACDMHGANGRHWTPMTKWQSFSPKASNVDPAFFGDEDIAFLGDASATFDLASPPPRRVRPSFSTAADRASRAAKTRIMMMDQSGNADEPLSTDEVDGTNETITASTALKADTQPVR